MYFVDDEGVTYVVKAGPKFELVSRNRLGEHCYGSPAVSQGDLSSGPPATCVYRT